MVSKFTRLSRASAGGGELDSTPPAGRRRGLRRKYDGFRATPWVKITIVPTVLRVAGFRFHFYSNEGEEPPHIHITSADGECKFWLEPIALAANRGLSAATVRRIERLVHEHQTLLREKYREFHGC